MTMYKLCEMIAQGQEKVIRWCQDEGLILRARDCPWCGDPCHIDYRSEHHGQPRWSCQRGVHKPFHESLANNTVFDGSHFGMDKLLVFFYLFAHGITEYHHLERETSSYEVEVPEASGPLTEAQRAQANKEKARRIRTSSATIRQWLVYCREICFVFLDKKFHEEGQIGGDKVVVEIDEAKFGKRKHHHGKFISIIIYKL